MRNWLIGIAILFATPANAGELISNNGFDANQGSTGAAGWSAATSWKLYNNTNASTFSEVVASYSGRSNLLHIVTDGSDNGAYQMFGENALGGYADVFVVSGQARFGAYTNGGMLGVTSSLSSTTGVFERLALATKANNPFNFVALFSYGAGAEFYVDFASAGNGMSEGIEPNVEPGAVPEPATWAMILFGFGAIGSALRRRKSRSGVVYA
jgi:hypothetical protein